MKYKIVVDKQSRTNPSDEKKEFEVDIEELRTKRDIYDSIIITREETYVLRKLELTELMVLKELEEPIKEPLDKIKIELFEGDNYIYLVDVQGSKIYAEYLVKNEFNELYVTLNEMNSAINETAQSIELSVNQKLTGYSTTEEMNSAINVKANEITSAVAKTYTTKGELTTAKSEIKQTTDSITSEVSKKVGNSEIISKINQSAEKIAIDADKIDINGKAVNFSTNISETIGPFTSADSDRVKKILLEQITPTASDYEKYDINGDGKINSGDSYLIKKAEINGGYLTRAGKFMINPYSAKKSVSIYSDSLSKYEVLLSLYGAYLRQISTDAISINKNDDNVTASLQSNVFGMQQGDGLNRIYMQIGDWYNNKSTSGISISHIGNNSGTGIDIIAQQDECFIYLFGKSKTTKISSEKIITPTMEISGAGKVMYGKDTSHIYMCHWTGSQLQFYVDGQNVGTLSDKRLKTEIQDIDEDFIKIIDEIEMKQFKIANRNGLVSFGILAQDLIEIFKKYNKNPFDYEIVQETQYRIDDDTIYYTINYEQFLILKQKATDIKLNKQQEQINMLLKEIQEMKGANNG